MLQPFNTVPHVVTPGYKVILLLLHNCNFATVTNHNEHSETFILGVLISFLGRGDLIIAQGRNAPGLRNTIQEMQSSTAFLNHDLVWTRVMWMVQENLIL